jgi:hypothetical protein
MNWETYKALTCASDGAHKEFPDWRITGIWEFTRSDGWVTAHKMESPFAFWRTTVEDSMRLADKHIPMNGEPPVDMRSKCDPHYGELRAYDKDCAGITGPTGPSGPFDGVIGPCCDPGPTGLFASTGPTGHSGPILRVGDPCVIRDGWKGAGSYGVITSLQDHEAVINWLYLTDGELPAYVQVWALDHIDIVRVIGVLDRKKEAGSQ